MVASTQPPVNHATADALLDKVRSRVAVTLTDALIQSTPTLDALNAIMADVETALVLARREGMLRGLTNSGLILDGKGPSIRSAFPLPTRTRQVLREEPSPGGDETLFRVRNGEFEMRLGGLWASPGIHPRRFDLMAHALDLHANPFRTEEVPGNENDPWGDHGASDV